jgi:hypothetical protein
MKKFITAIAIGMISMGCGANVIRSSIDLITGITTIEYANSLPLTYEGEGTGELISFLSSQSYQNPEYHINVRYTNYESNRNATLVIEYEAKDWMFIKQTTILTSDGVSYTFEDTNPYHDVHRGIVTERTIYQIPIEVLKCICDGTVRIIRVSGTHLYEDLTIPPHTQTKLADFWNNLVAKHPEMGETISLDTIRANGESYRGRQVD